MYEIIYIALNKEARVKSNKINIFEVCDIYAATDKKSALNKITFPVDEDVCIVSAIDVIEKISNVFPNVLIQNTGSTTDCVIKSKLKEIVSLWL
ncbi:MAG: stage V sporulation protein AA [Eubacteriales bacterium]